tara:strand:+ start:127 stop:546 length:420 start_codon:yes stop_codon:yes gene_type:complete
MFKIPLSIQEIIYYYEPMKYILSLILIGLLSGCASLTQGTSQLITINIAPEEAVCSLYDTDGEIMTLSGGSNMIQIAKNNSDILINCSANGYKSSVTRLRSTAETAGVVGVVIDFGLVDMLTGAMWKYPNSTSIKLIKE